MWWLGNKWQDRKAKEDAKRQLFLTLMANRQCNPINKEWVDALNNMIDVIYQDDKQVRFARRTYYDSLDPSSQYNKITNLFLLDLLSEMGFFCFIYWNGMGLYFRTSNALPHTYFLWICMDFDWRNSLYSWRNHLRIKAFRF